MPTGGGVGPGGAERAVDHDLAPAGDLRHEGEDDRRGVALRLLEGLGAISMPI